ncbi:hypothetical protein GR268_06755 [Rhizobium leguminosarum]|nr:hypothetical protein [Rhizobium leguminosarum]
MDENLLRAIAEKFLLPLFSGASLDAAASASNANESTVALIDPQTIGFKVDRLDNYRLKFRRDQPFGLSSDISRETQVIEAFVAVLNRMSVALHGPLKDDLLTTFQRQVVSEAATENGGAPKLLQVIDQMAIWATRLYEGAPISSAIGIDPTANGMRDLPLSEIVHEDFCAVLSNGLDTILTVDGELNLTGHEVLSLSSKASGLCPLRHSAVAEWTLANDRRIAVVLNRLGEILIFRNGQLLFARRSGNWHFLTHGPVIRQMSFPRDENIRQAIYETALDASFARTGACIGVIASRSLRAAKEIIAPDDWLLSSKAKKTKAISKIVAGRKLNELERTLRQELVAIDGATIVNHEGEIISVGAILKIDGGSTGGGRTAAAKQLAQFGLGIKVSQDGAISGYQRDPATKGATKAVFKVM